MSDPTTDPRDRAALYACELADASRVLDDAGVPGEPGEPLAHRVERGLRGAREDGDHVPARDLSRTPAMDPWRRLLDAAERGVREHGWDVETATAVVMARHTLDTVIEPREVDPDCSVCCGYRRSALREDIVAWHNVGHVSTTEGATAGALAVAYRRGYEHSARVGADPGDVPDLPVDLADPSPTTIATVDDLDGLPVGTVLRMTLGQYTGGRGLLIERDEDGWVYADGSEPLDTALVGATVLHVPGRTVPSSSPVTREAVVEAVRDAETSAALDPSIDVSLSTADRLGLTEGNGEGESRG